MPEPLLIGWANIHKLFYTTHGKPIMCFSTFYQKYHLELQELGIVFTWYDGSGRRPTMACWPSKVRNWWTLKKQQIRLKKKKIKEKGIINKV